MIAAGTMFMGAQLASASSDYPPDDDSVSPLPPAAPEQPSDPTPGSTLPSTGGESALLLQIGLVTVAAGGTLVGAAAVRRRRLSEH